MDKTADAASLYYYQDTAQQELNRLHLVVFPKDMHAVTRGSLMLVLQSGRHSEQFIDDLFQTAVNRGAGGIAFAGRPQGVLSPEQRQALESRGIFVLYLSRSNNYFSLVYQAGASSIPKCDLEAFGHFQNELFRICSEPYTALDVAMLLNNCLGRSVDLVVGSTFRLLIRHDTLNIVNVISIIKENLDSLMRADGMHICCSETRSAAVFPIRSVFAFLAIPFGENACVSDLEIALINEAMPCLALAIGRRSSSRRPGPGRSFTSPYCPIPWNLTGSAGGRRRPCRA